MKILSSFTYPQVVLNLNLFVSLYGGKKIYYIFKISSFVFSRRKKFTQVWYNLRVSK